MPRPAQLSVKVTFQYRMAKTTYTAKISTPSLTPRAIREELAAQVDESLRHVDLVHVEILGPVLELEETL